jgi:hypothetical protein
MAPEPSAPKAVQLEGDHLDRKYAIERSTERVSDIPDVSGHALICVA